MKRLLISIMLAVGITSNIWADTVIEGIKYTLNDDFTATVTGLDDKSFTGTLTIPDSIKSYGNTYYITNIGNQAFREYKFKTVIIPNSITSIEEWAFYKCSSLTSVTIGNSVTSIGLGAFQNCSGLTSVTINSNAIMSKDYSSSSNMSHIFGTQVKSYAIGDSVTSIGKYAFYNCSGLTSVTIGNSVTSIGEDAFYNCSGLTSITIPSSVTSIGDWAFSSCTGLTSVTIGNSVTSIGNSAFSGCSGLTSVTIPNSVTSIGGSAFSGCAGLTEINVDENNTAYSSINGVLFNKSQTELILYPRRKQGTYTIPNSVTSIGGGAFQYCSGLTSVTIPNSVKSIGKSAFIGCSGLTSVTIGNSVTSIGDYAFYGCSGLTSVTINSNAIISKDYSSSSSSSNMSHIFGTQVKSYTIGNSVTSIGNYAFYECKGLTSVTIPNSVTSIGNGAFSGCSGLTSVTIPNSVTSIGDYAFYGCSGLTSVTIPNSVTSIGYRAFSGCSGLTSVTIGTSVTSIGNDAFYRCSSLTSVTINSNAIISKDYSSDSNMSHIFGTQVKSYTIGNSVTSIGNAAFLDCYCLTSVTIPNSVTSIGNSAFSGCSSLTSVTIPNSVTSIGNSAFWDCNGLTDIYCHIEEPLTIASNVFYNVPKNTCTLHVPVGSKNKYKAADVWKDFLNIVGDLSTSGKIIQTITWKNSQSALLVNSEIELAAVASSGLPVTYTIKSGNDCGTLIVNGEKTFLKGTKKGDIVIEAKQAGNEDYHSVTTQKEFIVTDNILPIGTEFTVEKIVYRITSDTEVKVVGHNEISGDVIIPDKVYYPGSEQRYSVKDIGGRAFYDCTGMTSLTIPSSVKKIDTQAFRGCTGMTELILADGVETIGYAAFELCTNLTSVSIPNSVTYIDAWAFTACYALKTVLIPNSVTTINHHAFDRCNALEDIYCYIEYPLTVTDNTFSGVPKGQSGCKLHVPIGSGNAYRNADVWKEFNIVEDLPTGIVSIDNSQLTNDNDVWYTLNGTRLNGKPTKAGVYIVNGKKVVIK